MGFRKEGRMSFEGTSLRIIHFIDNPPANAIILRSNGWSEGLGGSWVNLECGHCGAQFNWPLDRQNKWLPSRRHLNFCPGCGKAIAGAEIPQCGHIHTVSSPTGALTFHCILSLGHPTTQDHEDGRGRKWQESSRGTQTTALPSSA